MTRTYVFNATDVFSKSSKMQPISTYDVGNGTVYDYIETLPPYPNLRPSAGWH